MKVEVFSCNECGGPLKVAEGQFVLNCIADHETDLRGQSL